jgi:hypothetical protein
MVTTVSFRCKEDNCYNFATQHFRSKSGPDIRQPSALSLNALSTRNVAIPNKLFPHTLQQTFRNRLKLASRKHKPGVSVGNAGL